MFFSKNKNKERDTDEQGAKALNSAMAQLNGVDAENLVKDVEIHVMPSKFLAVENKSKGGKKLLAVLGISFIVLGILTAAVLFIFKDNFIDESSTSPEPASAGRRSAGLKEIEGEEGEEGKEGEEGEEEIIIATSTAEIATTTQEISTSTIEIATTTPEISTTTPGVATTTMEVLDSDKDGLADLEEELFSSDNSDEDSDDDGYLDGIELVNLYNPISFAPQKLSESGLVKVYNESRFNIFYPIKWEAELIEEGNISFKADNGEFIQLIISPNPDSITPEEWYRIQIGMEEDPLSDSFKTIDNGINKKGLYYAKISDETIYISDYANIYVLGYNLGATGEMNFPSVFEMMLQSLESKIDTDGDGIADFMEIDIYKTDPKNIDTDGDGFNDWEEIEKGHDPLG